MVRITCDTCKTLKPDSSHKLHEDWILGYDLEVEGRTALQRSIRFLDKWDDRRVLELGAIHFCSEECRDRYLNKSRAVA